MSITIPVEIKGFAAKPRWAALDGRTHDYSFTWAEVLRAAIVAGYWDEVSTPSPQFRQWRAAAIQLAVRRSAGTLTQPPEWKNFDPSEKGAVTALLGVIVTKLLVERILEAPYLLFLDVHFTLTRTPGAPKLRPDFIALGPKPGGWEYFSVEAKGRTRFSKKGLNKGRDQARSLGTVDHHPVQAQVVCYTSLPKKQIFARFHDPVPKDKVLHNVDTKPGKAVQNYYRSYRKLIEMAGDEQFEAGESYLARSGIRFRWLREMDVAIGLHPAVEIALVSRRADWDRALMEVKRTALDSQGMLGPDGIAVVPGQSWG